MSLIHDALEKAGESKRPPVGSGLMSIKSSDDRREPRFPPRTIGLLVVLGLAIAFLAYTRLVPSGKSIPSAHIERGLNAKKNELVGGVKFLKKNAYNSFKAGDLKSALKYYSDAAVVAPSDPEIWNNLGLISERRGDDIAARKNYEKALGLKQDYAEALNNLAVLEMKKGNSGRAFDDLNNALKIRSTYPEANFNMAVLYDIMNKPENALKFYEKFLKLAGNFPNNVVESVRRRAASLEQ